MCDLRSRVGEETRLYQYKREMFYTLTQVIGSVTDDPQQHPIRLEKRPKRFMFGTLNYGEIPSLRNAADKCAWDVFVPGYDCALPINTPMQIEQIIGVLMLESNNHKIAVRVAHPGYDETRCTFEIARYCAEYTNRMHLHGKFVPFEVLRARGGIPA